MGALEVQLAACPIEVGAEAEIGRTHLFVRKFQLNLTSMIEQLFQIINNALGLIEQQIIKLDIVPGTQLIQVIRNSLLKGDPISSVHKILLDLTRDISGISRIKNRISDNVQLIQSIRNSLLKGDPVGSIHKILLDFTTDISGVCRIKNEISDSTQAIQKIINEMTGDGIQLIQRILNEIVADPDPDPPRPSETTTAVTSVFPDVTWNIQLDDVTIKSSITDVGISFDEDSVHNKITIASLDSELFWDANPEDLSGTNRIKLTIGSRVMSFLLESRTGDEINFVLSGRSVSARDDSPFTCDTDFILEEPKLASLVAQSLLNYSTLYWECDDWVLPKGFEFYGNPIEGIELIASSIGAVVRSRDNGDLEVRKKWPTRPINLADATADVDYTRNTELILINYDDITSVKYNIVQIDGYSEDIDLPDFEVEETDPVQGTDVHIRLYWENTYPPQAAPKLPTTWVSDGIITRLGDVIEKVTDANDDEEEVVIFEAGVGNLTRPLYSFTSVEWVGAPGANLTTTQYSKEVTIDDEAYRIAKIKYKTLFTRYRCSLHDVEILLALFTFGTTPDISVIVQMGAGDCEAVAIINRYLTSEPIAITRGTAFLDDHAYDLKDLKVTVPYSDDARDGSIASIDDYKIDCSGNFHIKNAGIKITGPKIVNTLTLSQPQV